MRVVSALKMSYVFRCSFTASRSSLPTLKTGNFFGCTVKFSPVLGFLPVYAPYSLTEKLPKPRSSICSPLTRVSVIDSRMVFTINEAFLSDRACRSAKASINSDLVIRSPDRVLAAKQLTIGYHKDIKSPKVFMSNRRNGKGGDIFLPSFSPDKRVSRSWESCYFIHINRNGYAPVCCRQIKF